MRLTLRTMLCYLDDVLKPEDAQEIAKKIEESEFASGLVHRIRGSMRKLRLGAPRLDGTGVGLDSNTVAEYLDSTLSSDRVPDFEKICLESDVHLAEVASCHQILTLVLGEPAEIGASLRERMYHIPEEAMRPRQQPASVEATAPSELPATSNATVGTKAESESEGTQPEEADAQTDDTTTETNEIPDYLKASARKRNTPLVATALLLFLAVSIAVFAIGPKNLARWFGGSNDDSESVADGGDDAAGSKNVDDDNINDNKPAPVSDGTHQEDKASSDNGAPQLPDKNESDAPSNAKVDQGNGETVAKSDAQPGAKQPDGTDSTSNVKPQPSVEPGSVEPKVASTEPLKPEASATTDKSPVPVEPAAVDVGRFVSEHQILARLDPKSGAWLRLGSNSQVMSEDRLLVLPTYRPQLALSSGVQLTVVGPTECGLNRPNDEGVPGLSIDYGRAVALTASKPNSQLVVNLAGTRGTITFVQADSVVAFEVIQYLPPGIDPETNEAQRIVQIFAPRAEVHWQPAAGEPVSLSENEILVLSNGKKTRGTLNVLPSWLETSDVTDIDKLASEEMEGELPVNRSLMLSLEELVEDNRVEVRMLAGRSLTYLDNFDAFVTMLSDKLNKSFWRKHLDAVQEGLARGPESAKALRVSFERIRGEKAGELYRLVWGYNSAQLAAGAAAQLVEYLSHEDLDFRAIVFENLYRITGKIGSYRPESREIERAPKINYWREKLANGEIVYRTPPMPRTLIPIE